MSEFLQQNLNTRPNIRIERINSIKKRRASKLQAVLDNSYPINWDKKDSFIEIIKKRYTLYNVKLLVEEAEFLREINESSRNNLDILKSIFDIINTKDVDGNTPITKAVLNDDAQILEYLLKKATSKIKAYNQRSPQNKLYLHNILDTKNNNNKTALQIAAESNIKCYNIILKYININYKDISTLDFMPNNIDLSNMEKIKEAIINTQSIIEKSYSLAIFYYKDSSTKIPSIDKLKANLINNDVCAAKKKLQTLLLKPTKPTLSISKKTLKKILDTKKLCEKLDDADKNSRDIILSRLKILTEPKHGITPIMQVTKMNDCKALSLLISEISSLKQLYTSTYKLRLPNYLDTMDCNYNTALSFAIKNQSLKCVELLLKSGATIGNDFEYSKFDSYIIQAIKVNNQDILQLIIKYYELHHNDKNSLKNYLCATTKISNYISPLGIAIKLKYIDCAILLHSKYNIPIPEQFKDSYKELLAKKYALLPKKHKKYNVIQRVVNNIINSIISLLYFLGIIQFKK